MYKTYYKVHKLDRNLPWPTEAELVLFCDEFGRKAPRGLIRKILDEDYALIDVFLKL